MKRLQIAAIVVATAALLAFPAQAFAEHLSGQSGWTVTFAADNEKELIDNYSAEQWADDIRGLEPGDDITFTVTLNHENASAADWYMSNDVIKSLETGAAQDSSYEYLLTYQGPSTSKTLYDSKTVGGDESEGLKEATSGLKDFMYLDSLSKGKTATVTLKVTLDGETEQNAYFDTLAQLKMKFAVELTNNPNTPSSSSKTAVKTGDDTDLFPYYVAMSVSGALLLAFAIAAAVRRKREREEGAR